MKPYEGVRVLDSTHVLAGPFASYQLAWMGAEVIRLEAIEDRDFVRFGSQDPILRKASMGDGFLSQNAGKHSVAINLKSEQGQEIYRQLAKSSDVVVENFRPGVMERLNIGYEKLCEQNPELIYCSLTGFGQDGPLRDVPAFDYLIQAMSGMMSVMGDENTGPMKVGFPLIDYITGLMGAFAISSALTRKFRFGKGGRIDTAMLDSALIIMTPAIAPWLISQYMRPNSSRGAASGSPFSGSFSASDGLLAIVANTPAQAKRLVAVVERPDLLESLNEKNMGGDPDYFDLVQKALAKVFKARTVSDWVALLNEAEVPAGPVLTIPEITAHPHLAHRGLYRTLDVPDLGREITIPGVGFQFPEGEMENLSPPPVKGSHTGHYLAELGYTPDQITRLQQEGIVRCADGE